MKTYTTYLFVLVLVFAVAGVRPAQAQFGVGAGLNYESFNDIDAGDTEATIDNATGWHIGVFYDLEAGPIGIRPGVFYSKADNIEVSLGDEIDVDFDLTLIRVPIDFRYMISPSTIRPYILGAPVFSFATSSGDFEDNIKELSVAADVGVGVVLALSSLRLMPEVRYSFGISNFFEDELQIGGVTIEPEDNQRLSTFMLRLNLVF